jgi:glycosyltransferase involved in cell wall biosynthesis
MDRMASPDSTVAGLAYLTTAYPSVSHTFIRREILGLERLGFEIQRFAIRSGTLSGDPDDLAEQAKTHHLLAGGALRLLLLAMRGAFFARLRVFTALGTSLSLSRASERGLLRHLAYLVEALALLSLFRDRNVRHVHVHFGTNAAAVAMLVKQLGGPTFSMTVHGPDEFDAAIGLSIGAKIAASSFTVAISNYCASQLRRWADFSDWGRIHVVHCTVGSDWFDAAAPASETSRDFVSVGRLSAQKAQILLIDAFADAVARGIEGRLILVGDGELRGAIEARIRARNLEDRVTITGWATGAQVREWLLRSRALVLPSFAEGLPMVLMEAMALQRPVIATQIAGIPELVRPGTDGWLVIAGDHDALVDAFVAAASADPDTLRRLGAQAQQRVQERHTTATEVGKLARRFHEVLDPKRTLPQ